MARYPTEGDCFRVAEVIDSFKKLNNLWIFHIFIFSASSEDFESVQTINLFELLFLMMSNAKSIVVNSAV